MKCPSCGREVEGGFRFCDGCGTTLRIEAETRSASATEQDDLRIPDSAAEEPASLWATLFGRWRRRREERSELEIMARSLSPPPRLEEITEVPEVPAPPTRPAGAKSRPVPAENLRGARPAVGGRLQWTAEEQPEILAEPIPATPAAPLIETDAVDTWNLDAISVAGEPETGTRPSNARLLIELVIGLLSGAIVLVVITAAASLLSDGSVAVLEARGLPIVIGGATSIVVFALITTSARNYPVPGSTRTRALMNLGGGLVALAVAAAMLYQPGIAVRVQPRIERAIGLFGGADAEAVRDFQEDIVEWNENSQQYNALLESQVRRGIEFNTFRERALHFETGLVGLIESMRSHAAHAEHAGLQDALDDLASIYEDQLGGLRVVNRGLLVDAIGLVRTGDKRYKDARDRAQKLFRDRLGALIDRAGFDSAAFGQTLRGQAPA